MPLREPEESVPQVRQQTPGGLLGDVHVPGIDLKKHRRSCVGQDAYRPGKEIGLGTLDVEFQERDPAGM